MIPVLLKGLPVFILFSSLMDEIPLPVKSILVLDSKFNSFFSSQVFCKHTMSFCSHKLFTSSSDVFFVFFLNVGAVHFIYQINRLTTTKVDSTYLG